MDSDNDNRFDLETAIINMHTTADDIDLLADAVIEGEMQPEDIVNALMGISALTRLRADKAFESFKAAYGLDEHRDKSFTA